FAVAIALGNIEHGHGECIGFYRRCRDWRRAFFAGGRGRWSRFVTATGQTEQQSTQKKKRTGGHAVSFGGKRCVLRINGGSRFSWGKIVANYGMTMSGWLKRAL